jgi:aspartate/tyrosine/aromatic aminotransferase
LNHEYLPQDGDAKFLEVSQKFFFGEESNVLLNGRAYTIQGLSGTGSLLLGLTFIKKFFPEETTVYMPDTTWGNHPSMCNAAGLKLKRYRYLDSTGCALDFDGLLADISACDTGSVILLHMCAHNPTGVDPSDEQWLKILDVIKSKNLLPFFDNAYQGFVTGDAVKDAMPARLFAETGLEMIAACSFAKNFGLYGQRVGALHMVTSTPDNIPTVQSQLRVISRSLYSTPPLHGARIVARVLGTPELKSMWESECKGMADRLTSVRTILHAQLVQLNVKGTWDHIIAQRGMFSFTGLSADAVKRLKEEHHVYMLGNGRISLAGLNDSNIERFAKAILQILGTN